MNETLKEINLIILQNTGFLAMLFFIVILFSSIIIIIKLDNIINYFEKILVFIKANFKNDQLN
jgi:hypothetical protein